VRGVAILLVVVAAGCGGARVARTPTRAHPHRPPHGVRILPRRVHGPHRAPVPILEYHVIGDPPPGAPYPGLFQAVADFRAQLGWLAAHGYHPVTLDRVLRYWQSGYALPRRPVVLTFDDGYPQDVTTVMPLLRARHWPAVLNLHVGNLIPERIRELIRAGWEIDAHTFTHPDLTRVGPAQLVREVAGSRAWIRRMFHQPVDFFCYPSGRYDAAVIAEVRRAGYAGAETEIPVAASPREMWTLGRFEILRGEGLDVFAAKLRTRDPSPA
jgi:peptidoglycan/xylan/chitin deacetylase (PgdA/CDA1 family)